MVKLLGQQGVIPAFAKDDSGFQALLIHSDQNVRNLCKARQAIKSWPLHIKRVNNMTNQATASGGLLRCPLHYYGAHTGRWSGGEKINLQNLGGRGRAGSGTHPLIAAMRSLLSTPDGMTLGIADSAQIEARILAWFANQDDLTTGFAEGKSPYCTLATKLFGEKVWKPSDEEKKTSEGQTVAIKYGFGKDSILGCGFGMGPVKFYSNCIANNDLRPLFKEPFTSDKKSLEKLMQQYTKNLIAHGIGSYIIPNAGEYDEKFIAYLILIYRITYAKIPEFWSDVEKAFRWVIKYPHESTRVSRMYDKNNNAAGFRLVFFNRKGTVHIQLPSGREFTYRHCAIKKTTKGSEIRWHYGHLWGGSITENIVQATARDLLAHWILEMEKDRLNVIFHNHDEIICMLLDDSLNEPSPTSADMGLDDMMTIMRTGPDWVAGLPLDAEGCLSECYKK